MVNIGFDLFEIHLAVWIERRRDGRENTLQKHVRLPPNLGVALCVQLLQRIHVDFADL